MLAWRDLDLAGRAVRARGIGLQLAGWLRGPLTSFMWLPMLAFEVPLGLRLLTGGVACPPLLAK